jgi:hypothetical protein
MKRYYVFFFVFIITFCFFYNRISISQQQEFVIAPPFYFLESIAGDKGLLSFYLINHSEKELKMNGFLVDVYQKTDGQVLPVFDSDQKFPYSCLDWLNPMVGSNIKEITIPPNDLKQIDIELKVPNIITPGSYLASFVLIPEKESKLERPTGIEEGEILAEFQSAIELRFSNLICINIVRKGKSIKKYGLFGEISDLNLERIKDQLIFSSKFSNNGLYIINASGKIMIKDKDGRGYEMPLGGGGSILPKSEVYFKTTLPKDGFLPGEYSAKATINYGGYRDAISNISFRIDEKELEVKKDDSGEQMLKSDIPIIAIENDIIINKIIPNSTRTLMINVKNETDHNLKINTILEDSSQVDFTKFKENVEVEPHLFELLPKKRASVKVNVKVPDLLSDGNKYITIYFSPQSIDDKELTDGQKMAFAVPVNIIFENVRSEIIEKIKVENVDISLQKSEDNHSLVPNVKVDYINIGNTHINPVCKIILTKEKEIKDNKNIIIMDDFNQETKINMVSKEQNEAVIPGGEGIIYLTSQDVIEPGKYKIEVTISNGKNEIFSYTTVSTLE